MKAYSHELVEEYVLEIIARAYTIQGQCKVLLSKNFASDAPKNLCKTLINICDYLIDAVKSIFKSIDWNNPDKIRLSMELLQTSDSILKELGSHIRYVDGAQTQKLPWSFAEPIKKLIKKFMPDIEIMIRPQWKYNYTIMTTNLYDFYFHMLFHYRNIVSKKSLAEVLSPLNKYFYIVSFPSVERKNVLLHCLLGHEIGHLAVSEYLTETRKKELLQTIASKITTIVNKRTEAGIPDVPPLFVPQVRQQIVQSEIKRATDVWQRGLEETLSDIIGVFLFGPSVLFSTLEIALQDLYGFDKMPDANNGYYPPWRMRLRNIYIAIVDNGLFPLPQKYIKSKLIRNSVTKRCKMVEEIINETSDIEAISKDPILEIAFEEINNDIKKAKEFYTTKSKLKTYLVSPLDLYESMHYLIERIDAGIPPNAYEKNIDERKLATIIEIINAVWFHKLSWGEHLFDKGGNFNQDINAKKDRMNRLALKAIEYSDIEFDYIDKRDILSKGEKR